jgi:hypothetical protein
MSDGRVEIDRTVLSLLAEAAGVRRDQWQAVANGDDPADSINELYEADADEGREMAKLIGGAVDYAYRILSA